MTEPPAPEPTMHASADSLASAPLTVSIEIVFGACFRRGRGRRRTRVADAPPSWGCGPRRRAARRRGASSGPAAAPVRTWRRRPRRPWRVTTAVRPSMSSDAKSSPASASSSPATAATSSVGHRVGEHLLDLGRKLHVERRAAHEVALQRVARSRSRPTGTNVSHSASEGRALGLVEHRRRHRHAISSFAAESVRGDRTPRGVGRGRGRSMVRAARRLQRLGRRRPPGRCAAPGLPDSEEWKFGVPMGTSTFHSW